jgi:hypothetical protein
VAFSETLRLAIVGDTSGFSRTMHTASTDAKKLGAQVDQAQSKAKKFGGGFAQFGKVAAIGLAGVGVAAVSMADDFVRAAEESNKVTAQTQAVIESMGLSAVTSADQIAKLSEKLSLKSGIDDELIQSGANVLLTFRSLAETAGETGGNFDRATQAALDMSVALGTNMNSASIQVGKALNDPIRGLTALRRAGVQFTEAQEEQIKKMVEAGDVAGAQKLILKELEAQFGGSAEAQATASDKLRVAWGNLQETLGEKLLPIVEAFSTWATETGIPALESFLGWMDRNRGVMLALAAVVGGVLVAAFTAWAVSVIAATWPIIAIGAAVGLIAILIVKHFDTIKSAFATAFNWLKNNWPKILAILLGPMGIAVMAIIRYWDNIRDAFVAGYRHVRDFFLALPGRIVAFFRGAASWLLDAGKRVIRGLFDGLKWLWDHSTVGWFVNRRNAILEFFRNAASWLFDAGKRVIRGLFDGLKWLWEHSTAKWLLDRKTAVRNFFTNAGKWLFEKGKDVIRGLWNGLKDIWNDVKDWFLSIPNWIKEHKGPLSLDRELLVDAGKAIMGGFLRGLRSGAGQAIDYLKGIGVSVAGLFGDFFSGNLNIGANVTGFNALGKAMAAAIGWTGNQWNALNQLWIHESGWNPSAYNQSSGASGIPQALPASKMGPAAQLSNPDVFARARAQIAWGLQYIADRYGTPVNAWAAWQSRSPHWYAAGGVVPGSGPVSAVVHGGEGIFTPAQMKALGGGPGHVMNIHVHVAGSVISERELVTVLNRQLDNGARLGAYGRRSA